MRTMSQWNEIRAGLHESGTKAVHRAAIAVGKGKAEELPEDIADAVLALFSHADPEVRVEAIRAIGVHWRLARATEALAKVLQSDEDTQVRLSAIGGLGCTGREHADVRCLVSKALAGAVLNERFGDYERMVAYLELLHVEGRIRFEEYMVRDLDLPENLDTFDMDRPWVEELMQRDCAQP